MNNTIKELPTGDFKVIIESDLSKKQKVDKLIQLDTEMHTNLGIDSTDKERQQVQKLSSQIIDEVVKIDPELKYLQTSKDK